MKTRILTSAFIAGLMAFVVAGCTPPTQVKNIAGESVPKLETNLIDAVWLTGGNDKGVFATHLKDATTGLVEAATLDVKEDGIALQKFSATLRDSPVGMLFSAKFEDSKEKQDGYWFGRAVIAEDHLVLFLPDDKRIKELAERGLLKGAAVKNEKNEDTSQFLIESLDKEDFDRLLTNGINPITLFSQDPSIVCVRLSRSR